MTRRIAVPLVIVALALAGIAAWWLTRRDAASQAAATTPPQFVRTADQNILLVTIDTLRADALGSYGGRAATPNLDRLASEGVRYAFAHAHAVVTLPSHASIMTGRYPHQHGVRDNSGYRLDDAADTIAEVAKRWGLATGAFVGAFPLDRQFGLNQGFDVYDDVGGLGKSENEFLMAERRAEEVVARARGWIEKQTGPWFTWVHVFDPHAPYENGGYEGEVAYVDRALGPLLQLARDGSRPTTVIVTSDHGEGLGEHGELTHGTFAYESTLRVPLILAQVGQGITRETRTVANEPRQHVEIKQTIAQLLGDRTVTDLWRGSLLQPHSNLTYFEAMTPMLTHGWAPLRGVIDGREKYIELPLEEVYDLAGDPKEQQNIAAGRVARLSERLRAMNPEMPGEQRRENAEVRERLQALGYVSASAPRRTVFTEADDPKNLIEIDRLILEGIDHYQHGRAREAAMALMRAIDKRPDMIVAYRQLAFIQWDTGFPGPAIQTLKRGLAQREDAESEVRLGTYLAETGAVDEAMRLLTRAAAADPKNAQALNALGIAQARAGRTREALATFEKILSTDARNVHAHENIGTVHLGTQNLQAASASFARALEIAPGSSRAHAGLGAVAAMTGRRNEAIARWRRAVELDRRNFDALFNLATELLNAGRHAEARPYVEQFVRTAPRAFYSRDIDRLAQLLR